jgi:hypothetical protein
LPCSASLGLRPLLLIIGRLLLAEVGADALGASASAALYLLLLLLLLLLGLSRSAAAGLLLLRLFCLLVLLPLLLRLLLEDAADERLGFAGATAARRWLPCPAG